ncbi:MAG: hypothetical protein ABEJ42_08465, partial [Halobacteriaceae archaeon]
MDEVDASKVLLGAAGVLFAVELAPPGRYVLAVGPVAFDAGVAALAGSAFLAAWGVTGVLVRRPRVQATVDAAGADATALALVLVNDAIDYLWGLHPPLRYEPGIVL